MKNSPKIPRLSNRITYAGRSLRKLELRQVPQEHDCIKKIRFSYPVGSGNTGKGTKRYFNIGQIFEAIYSKSCQHSFTSKVLMRKSRY